jgi:diguanylate cyclase (GGDEF)-like protein
MGLPLATLVLTGFAIVISLIISLIATRLAGGTITLMSVLLAILIPIVIGFTIGYATLRLVFQLYDTEQRLHSLSIHDSLTGLFNRRHFIALAETEWQWAKEGDGPFAVILFDIDHFKKINDKYGHLAGDEVLKAVSQVCSQASRSTDTLARFGGDEFIFLVNNAGQSGLRALMERVRSLLADTSVQYDGYSLEFTISMGAARYSPDIVDLSQLLARADRALYAAKSQGGDQWVMAGDKGV